MILLNLIPGPLSWEFYTSSFPFFKVFIFRFVLFIVSQFTSGFMLQIFRFGIFFNYCVHFFYSFSLICTLPFRLLCRWCLCLEFLITFLGFLSSRLPQFVLSSLVPCPFLDSNICVHFLHVFNCIVLYLFKLILFPFKYLYLFICIFCYFFK